MLENKILEVRDRATFISVLAVQMNPAFPNGEWIETLHLRRCGYGDGDMILMTRLDGSGKATTDPYDWNDRTMQTAHQYITANWSLLKTGDVVDVEYILKETESPKVSEFA